MIRKVQREAFSSTDPAHRLTLITDLAIELIGDKEKAAAWLRTPSTYLGGETPASMLGTQRGTELVVESLYSVAHGGTA